MFDFTASCYTDSPEKIPTAWKVLFLRKLLAPKAIDGTEIILS